jgi:hypothetical protein
MINEVWKPIPDFPGYEVSNHGRVRSYKKTGFPHLFSSSPRILKATPNHFGYPAVTLRNGQSYQWRVHQLVMLVFVGPCPEGMEVCHRDGNPLNNHLSNLRYDTHINNLKDITRYEFRKSQCKGGSLRALQIRTEYANGQATLSTLSKKYGIDIRAISGIINGKTWLQAGGPIKGIDYQVKIEKPLS